MCIQCSKVPRTSVKTRCQVLLICGLKGPDQLLTSAKATFQLGLDAAEELQQGDLGVLGKRVWKSRRSPRQPLPPSGHKDASHAGLKGEHAGSWGRPTAHSPAGPPEPCASATRWGLPWTPQSLPLRRCTRCRPESSTPLYRPDDGSPVCTRFSVCVLSVSLVLWDTLHFLEKTWPALSPEGILPSRWVDHLAWMVHFGAFLKSIHPVCPTTVPCPLKTAEFTSILSQKALFLRDLYKVILH